MLFVGSFDISRLLTRCYPLLVVLVHFGVLECLLSDDSAVEEEAEIVVPFDVAGAADDVLEGACAAVVVGNRAGDSIVVVL